MNKMFAGINLTRLRAQFIKEILSVLRDPRSRMVVLIPPILQLVVFAFAATLEVRNVDIAIINQDSGKWSQEFVQRLDKASFISNVLRVNSKDEFHELIDQGKIIAGLNIPVDFSRAINSGKTGLIQAIVDGRRSNSGQITVAYLSTIAADISADISNTAQTTVAVRHWFNPNLIYQWYVVPGLTGILALFSALLITSLSISRERELGTFDQLLVSPTNTIEIIIAKSLPAMIIGTILGILMVIAGTIIFQIPFTGSLSLLMLSLTLFILAVVGIGLMISAVSLTQQQAILGAFGIGVPAVLMSGFATPVENMPTILQWLAQAIPLTHFLIIVEGSFLKAMPTVNILNSLWPLALIAACSLIIATFFVRGRLQ